MHLHLVTFGLGRSFAYRPTMQS